MEHVKINARRVYFLFFLHKRLSKMALNFSKCQGNKEIFVYHHGLIKLIMLDKLVRTNQTWIDFLQRNQFGMEEAQPLVNPNEINLDPNEGKIEGDVPKGPEIPISQ